LVAFFFFPVKKQIFLYKKTMKKWINLIISIRELRHKRRIALHNLKDKFTYRNLAFTIVSLVFAYLLRPYLIYLLNLDLKAFADFLLFGLVYSGIKALFKDLFEIMFPTIHCMDKNIEESIAAKTESVGNPGASAGLPSESASALAEAEAAGHYNKYHTPESAEKAKNLIKKNMTSGCNAPFDESYTPKDFLNGHKEGVKAMSEDVSNLSNVKGYFEAIESGREPSLEEKKQYDIRKNRYLGHFNEKET